MSKNDKDKVIIENSIHIKSLKEWQRGVDGKLDSIQNRQNIEMIFLFISIATFFITNAI